MRLIFFAVLVGVSVLGETRAPRVDREARRQFSIPAKPDSYTWKDYHKAQMAWCQRTMVESFAKIGHTGKPWEADATAFVPEGVKLWEDANLEIKPELVKRARTLLKTGCDDPLVLYLCVRLISSEGPEREFVLSSYRRAIEQFERVPYPRGVARFAALACADVYLRARRSADAFQDKAVAWTADALKDGSYKPDEDYLFVQHNLVPSAEQLMDYRVNELQAAYAESALPEWAKLALTGKIEIKKAWVARGGGWAKDVAEAGWKGFKEHLTGARAALTKSWELRPDRPEAASAMLTIVMGGEGDTQDTLLVWFRRAMNAQFDYWPAYDAMFQALRPRWGGSWDAMVSLGRACLATKRFDTPVPSYFFKALELVYDDGADWREIYRQPEVARDIVSLSEAMASEERSDARQSLLAVNAWMAGQYEDVRRVFHVGDSLHPRALKRLDRFHVTEGWFRSEMIMLASPGKEEYLAAETLYARHMVAEAIPHYERAITNAPSASFCAQQRNVACQLELEWARGDWVKLPMRNMGDWDVQDGRWFVNSDGELEGIGVNGRAFVASPMRVGANFELRGEFTSRYGKDSSHYFAVVLGSREGFHSRGLTFQLLQDAFGSIVRLRDANVTTSTRTKDLPVRERNLFRVKCWDALVSVTINDVKVVVDHHLPIDADRLVDSRVVLGLKEAPEQTTVRIRNLAVRALSRNED